jgi:rare lipoprotein A
MTQFLKATLLAALFTIPCIANARTNDAPAIGHASWYGEDHRGRKMANGQQFDPCKMTAASWFYPLGTRVMVTLREPGHEPRSVIVTITDRGPAKRLVRDGRIIDLAQAPFQKLAPASLGLIPIQVRPLQ